MTLNPFRWLGSPNGDVTGIPHTAVRRVVLVLWAPIALSAAYFLAALAGMAELAVRERPLKTCVGAWKGRY